MLLIPACQRASVQLPVVRARAHIPRVRATVLVVKTNLLPERQAFLHLVIVANGKARIGNELDRWRLFDLQGNSVTFVDEIARTHQTEAFASLVQQKRQLLRRRLPESLPIAQFVASGHRRTFDEFDADLYLIRLGGYQRSLWMATNVAVPDPLFPLMVASDPLNSPYSPMMEQVFEGMLQLKGFPVIDRSDITYGGDSRVVEKRLLRVEQRMVPASWLQLPADYRDLTPKPTEPPERSRPLRRALDRLTR